MSDKESSVHDLGSIEFSLKYPTSNKHSKYGSLLIGTFLIISFIFIAPIFLIFGYSLRIKEDAAYGREEVSTLSNWGELIKEGFIGLISFTPIIFVLFLSPYPAEIHPSLYPISLLLFILPLLYLPAFSVIYAKERDMRKAYKSRELYSFIFSLTYIIGLLKYFFLIIVLVFLYIFVTIITLGIASVFLLSLFVFSRSAFWGHTYYKWELKNRK